MMVSASMQPETAEEIEIIRAKLIEAEEGGMSRRSVAEIWEQARKEVKGFRLSGKF